MDERGEQISEHRLHRQRDGNAADTQPGHQGGDVYAQVVHGHQQHERPYREPDDKLDDRQRGVAWLRSVEVTRRRSMK